MMTPELVFGAITVLLAIFGTIAGVVRNFKKEIADAKAEAIGKAEDIKAETLARTEAAHSLANAMQVQLAAHQLHVAESYATKASSKELTDQIVEGFRRLNENISKLNERMDRIIEGRRQYEGSPG